MFSRVFLITLLDGALEKSLNSFVPCKELLGASIIFDLTSFSSILVSIFNDFEFDKTSKLLLDLHFSSWKFFGEDRESFLFHGKIDGTVPDLRRSLFRANPDTKNHYIKVKISNLEFLLLLQ